MDRDCPMLPGPDLGRTSSSGKRSSPDETLTAAAKKTKPAASYASVCLPHSQPAVPAVLDQPRHRKHPAFLWKDREIPERPADATTILLRPTDGTLHTIQPRALVRAFEALNPVPVSMRRIGRGGLALDFPSSTDPGPLLLTQSFAGIPVIAQLPRETTGVWGTVRACYDSVDELRQALDMHQDQPAVSAIRRLGKTNFFALRFPDGHLPKFLLLCFERVAVRTYFEQPRRCFRCQRFGHVAASCRGNEHCSKCGRQGHNFKACTADAAWCINCGGNHATVSRDCPHLRFETDVCKTAARTGGFPPAVRKELAAVFLAAFRGGKSAASTTAPLSSPADARLVPATPLQKSFNTVGTQVLSQDFQSTATQTAPELPPAPLQKSASATKIFPMSLYKPLKTAVSKLMTVGARPDFTAGMLENHVLELFRVINDAQDHFDESGSDSD